jgi:microcin C transport system permease protein
MRKQMDAQGNRGMRDAGGSLTDEQKEQLAAYFGFEGEYKPDMTAQQKLAFAGLQFKSYLRWLGALPREVDKQFVKFEQGKDETAITLRLLLPRAEWKPNNAYKVTQATLTRDGQLRATDTEALKPWHTRAEAEKERVQVYRTEFSGLLQGDLGVSTSYNDYVWKMMRERMPVSIFYGLATFLLTYMVCIPLGIVKAIKHRTVLDNVSSVLIFIGYAIPGFVLASVLVVYLAARLGWFPTGGFVSENFSKLNSGAKVWDVLYHAVLPLICYMVGAFAFTTMLMKNNLMDNLAADYVRTAVAKGASFRRAVFVHAFRNSLIPLATTLGHIVSIFVAGSVLIELIFEINGFGLLSYNSLMERDYPLVMGILTVEVLLIMVGNILSDFCVALADPRIRFE